MHTCALQHSLMETTYAHDELVSVLKGNLLEQDLAEQANRRRLMRQKSYQRMKVR